MKSESEFQRPHSEIRTSNPLPLTGGGYFASACPWPWPTCCAMAPRLVFLAIVGRQLPWGLVASGHRPGLADEAAGRADCAGVSDGHGHAGRPGHRQGSRCTQADLLGGAACSYWGCSWACSWRSSWCWPNPLAELFLADDERRWERAVLRWFAVAQLFSAPEHWHARRLMGAGDTVPALRYHRDKRVGRHVAAGLPSLADPVGISREFAGLLGAGAGPHPGFMFGAWRSGRWKALRW